MKKKLLILHYTTSSYTGVMKPTECAAHTYCIYYYYYMQQCMMYMQSKPRATTFRDDRYIILCVVSEQQCTVTNIKHNTYLPACLFAYDKKIIIIFKPHDAHTVRNNSFIL